MMSFAEAIEEFEDFNLADMMLESEYNQFIRGLSYKKSPDRIEFELLEEEHFLEELRRVEEELPFSSID